MLYPVLSLVGEAWRSLKVSNMSGLGDMLKHNWYLGLTSFGGPAVHFQIVYNLLGYVKGDCSR